MHPSVMRDTASADIVDRWLNADAPANIISDLRREVALANEQYAQARKIVSGTQSRLEFELTNHPHAHFKHNTLRQMVKKALEREQFTSDNLDRCQAILHEVESHAIPAQNLPGLSSEVVARYSDLSAAVAARYPNLWPTALDSTRNPSQKATDDALSILTAIIVANLKDHDISDAEEYTAIDE